MIIAKYCVLEHCEYCNYRTDKHETEIACMNHAQPLNNLSNHHRIIIVNSASTHVIVSGMKISPMLAFLRMLGLRGGSL